MSYSPNNTNGQATSANSAPVVVASDQSPVPVKLNTGLATTTGTIVANNGTVTVTNLAGIGSFLVTIYGTYAGVNITFEVYDGVQWSSTLGYQSGTTTPVPGVQTGALGTNSTNIFMVTPLYGATQFRVRANAYTSGTVNIILAPGPQATQPLVIATQPSANNLQMTVGTALPAGGNTIGTVNANLNTGSNTIGGVTVSTKNTGGATSFTLVSAATTNATNVKTSAGTLYGIYASNNGAGAAYLKIYNKASAPTVGTDTPVLTIMLPAGGGSNLPIPPQGINFSTGIAYAVTGVGTTADTTAVAAAQVFVNGVYF